MEYLPSGSVIGAIFDFTFYYPLFMSYLWMVGGLYYYFHYERADPPFDEPPPLKAYPPVSILVPCHNEAGNIEDTVESLKAIDYPDFEILLINDGSTDATAQILDRFAKGDKRIRVIHMAANQARPWASTPRP